MSNFLLLIETPHLWFLTRTLNCLVRVRYQLGGNSTLEQVILGDGLGDDIVSTVIVKRDKKKLSVSAHGGQSDKMEIIIPGEDDYLDLNGFIYVGGYANPSQLFPSFHRVNFRGCMYQATFNGKTKVDFIDGVLNNKRNFQAENVEETNNPKIPPRAMNFNHNTFIRFEIQFEDPTDTTGILQKFFGSFDFRTVLFEGTIFTASSVSLRFQRSQLSLVSGGDILSIDFPDEGQANDGRWFRVKYHVENTVMRLQLDDQEKRIRPANNPQYGSKITFGYYNNRRNFIGCIRNMVVQKLKVTYYEIINPYRSVKLADDYSRDDLTEGCKASDPCIPNPCFHDSRCLTVVRDPGVQCECRENYKPPLCQFCKYIKTRIRNLLMEFSIKVILYCFTCLFTWLCVRAS